MTSTRDAVSSAIASAIHAAADEMVTKWVALVETIDENGERGLWTLASEGSTPWDTLGLVEYSRQREQAAIVRREGESS